MSLTQKSVLIVDDMKMVRMRLKLILTDLQVAKIFEAGDGVEALELLKANRIDLVLSDWNMPRMTGVELVHAMRAEPELKSTPVMFITSESQKAAVLELMALGVSDYAVKPFTDDDIKQKVQALLAKSNG